MHFKGVELDDLDYKILSALMSNARKSIREIAKEVGASPATVHNRIRRLVEKGIIRGFYPMLDTYRLGYQITAIIMLSVEGSYLTKLEEELKEIKNITAIYDITGDYDILIIAKFKDMESLDIFVKELINRKGIKKSVTHIAFKVVKEDLRLPL